MDEKLVGLALAEPRWWHKSLWIWEFHVDPAYQGEGIGRRLMAAVGLTVHTLKRVAFGPLELGNLPRGGWRPLEPREIELLRAMNGKD